MNHRRIQSQQEWSFPITTQLDLVERELETVVASKVPAASDLSMRLLSAGGKRIRPALLILSALAAGAKPDSKNVIRLASATELFHMASLVHDDVVDETSERRGVRTANSKWGNQLSVLGGDFLLSKALYLLADEGHTEITRLLASVAVNMTESEMLQATSEGSVEMWKTNYWNIIHGKTAVFMSACCECGAVIASTNAEVRKQLAEYGTNLGIAFQITDDVLDIAGDPAQLGKDIGTDLLNGKFTLPVLLALENIDADHTQKILALAKKRLLTKEEALNIANLVIESGAVEMARKEALSSVQKACENLTCLPESEYVYALEALALSVISREV